MFPPEPTVRISTTTLTNPQAMTVRVAHEGRQIGTVTTVEEYQECSATLYKFRARLEDEGLGDDETGKSICESYIHHAGVVLRLLEREFAPVVEVPHV